MLTLREYLNESIEDESCDEMDTIAVMLGEDEIITISGVCELLESDSDCLDMSFVGSDRDDDNTLIVVVSE